MCFCCVVAFFVKIVDLILLHDSSCLNRPVTSRPRLGVADTTSEVACSTSFGPNYWGAAQVLRRNQIEDWSADVDSRGTIPRTRAPPSLSGGFYLVPSLPVAEANMTETDDMPDVPDLSSPSSPPPPPSHQFTRPPVVDTDVGSAPTTLPITQAISKTPRGPAVRAPPHLAAKSTPRMTALTKVASTLTASTLLQQHHQFSAATARAKVGSENGSSSFSSTSSSTRPVSAPRQGTSKKQSRPVSGTHTHGTGPSGSGGAGKIPLLKLPGTDGAWTLSDAAAGYDEQLKEEEEEDGENAAENEDLDALEHAVEYFDPAALGQSASPRQTQLRQSPQNV